MIEKRTYITYTAYYNTKGEYHNPHGPAYMSVDGRISYVTKFSFLNGKAQNIVGPYRTNTRVYYINNIRIDTKGYSNDKFTK